MVEFSPSAAADLLRNLTPKPHSFVNENESESESCGASYAHLSSTVSPHSLRDSSELAHQIDLERSSSYMSGGSRGAPDSAGGNSRRSSSYKQFNQSRRPPPNPTPAPHFSQENTHGLVHGPAPNYPPSSQYGQRSGFFGQYTMSPQPPMAMPPSNPSYTYPHGYQSVADNAMMSQNIHASYQPMLPPASVYPYQRRTPDVNSSGFSGQPMFTQSNTSSATPNISPPSSSQNTPPYSSPGQFHSLRYSSPISPPQYQYSHSYPTSPVYQSQYAPVPYPQHYPSPSEVDGQGTWFYVPPNAPSYHYPINYSPVHPEMENTYQTPSSIEVANYPMSPVRSPSPLNHSSSLEISPNLSPAPPSPMPAASFSKSAFSDKAVRRPYHPSPPSHRSDWVMWSGNVPSDASHDELWHFFNQMDDSTQASGVVSIFLISRSSCAFVNFKTEADLQNAIARFNGMPLRPQDLRCPRLVCRVRKKDDDLKAGVGGQRGVGMHIKWLRDQRDKAKGKTRVAESEQSDADDASSAALSMSVSSDDEGRPSLSKTSQSNSSGSYASTNSSLLARHFPKRYFILKSLSQYDLDLSVEKNLWATQKHNEGILDQAYRASSEVYLIFGVNKSGEFYGYARMAGPVRQGEHRVSWATRTESSASSHSSHSPIVSRAPVSDTIPEEPTNGKPLFPDRMVDASPLPVTPASVVVQSNTAFPSVSKGLPASAPAELGKQHHRITMSTPSERFSLDNRQANPPKSHSLAPAPADFVDPTPDNFTLDESAPFRAVRSESSEYRLDEELSNLRLQSVEEVEERPEEPERLLDDKGEAWGESFKVEWICTERLPFYRTRHLKNPWNHDREVKVSRDGTELEPSVGEQLLEEWDKLVEEMRQQQINPSDPAPSGSGTAVKPGSAKRLGANSKLTQANPAKASKDRDLGLSNSRS